MRILTASKVDPSALKLLQAKHDVISVIRPPTEELLHLIGDREVLILRSGVAVDARVLDAAPRLKLVIRAGSGLDNIDLDALERRGVALERIPGPAARSVAELAFGLMLAVHRRIVEADRSMRDGRWLKSSLVGRTLEGKMLGIVGLGNIGSKVAELGKAWGLAVTGCVEFPSEELRREFAQQEVQLLELPEVLASADIVSIHVPLQASTRGLIGEAEIRRMKRGAVLIHLARGGVVDEGALRAALVDGHLGGAGVDVHVREGEGCLSPLVDLPNVVLTPHVGSTTVDTQREIGARILRIIARYEGPRAVRPGRIRASA